MAESGSQGDEVINKLFCKPYRIIHISAHGIFQEGSQGNMRSGVVLSDGLFLTAAEIGQLEVVPHLVFLNCCFLGQVNPSSSTAFNRLAYSLARELIEIGVRAVVAAGWAVRDDAGEFFAETFYHALLHKGESFGNAIHNARLKIYTDPRFKDCNTWGAYQAYGDPDFRMDPIRRHSITNVPQEPIAVEELIAAIDELSTQVSFADANRWQLTRQLDRLLNKAPKQ
jgi:CHAT domain-containing protein